MKKRSTAKSLLAGLAMLVTVAMFAAACGSDSDSTADATGAAAGVEDTTAADTAADTAEEEAAEEDAAEEEAEDAAAEEDAPAEDAAAEEEAEEAAAEDVSAEEAAAESGDVPTRIVSLNPTGTEMLFAVGAGDQVIAVDNLSYYPPEAPVVADLAAYTPSVEAIATFEPDLVVTQGPVEGLEALGVDVLELTAAASLDDVYAQIEQVGAVTGHIGDAAELVAQMQADIAAVLADLPQREVPLTYYHELDNTLYSVTSQTFVGHIYGLLGLENVADAADPDGEFFGYPQLNEEFLVETNPDIIFLADTLCCEQSAETVAARPGWDQLRAVQVGNVVELNDDVVSRWGPRLVEFIQVAGEAVAAVDTAPAS